MQPTNTGTPRFCRSWLGRWAAAVGLGMTPAAGLAQLQAPVTPTVPAPTVPGYVPAAPSGLPSYSVTTQLPGGAGQPADGGEGGAARSADGPELTLGQCVAVALDNQPSLRAVRGSQAATLAGSQALQNIGRLGQLISPDLPIRKEQSARGVVAAAADVQKQHNQVVYVVTRLYYTVAYARQQLQVTEDAVAQLDLLVKSSEIMLKTRQGMMTQARLDTLSQALLATRKLEVEARTGVRKAEAALRQAMGVTEATFPFRVKGKEGPDRKDGRPPEELPLMAQQLPLTRDMVVDMALCRRPELALAAAGVDAFRLEVYAQGRTPFRRAVPTFATGSDIHARMIPPGNLGKDYRPEPVVPELPPQLVGSKADRVTRALAYAQRAEAVYDNARSLVVLEAETSLLAVEQADEQLRLATEAFALGRRQFEFVQENLENPNTARELLLSAATSAARSRADYYEAVFQYNLALADLERVTAGGVRPAFPNR